MLRPDRDNSPKGFTVLELGIALVLLGLILGVSIPAVNSLSGAELKKQVGMFQGLIREAYARAALSGAPHRLVFEMDRGVYWVEETQEKVLLGDRNMELSDDGKAALQIIDDRIEDLEDDKDDPKASTMLQLLKGPTWSKVPEDIGQEQKMHPDVRFAGIWVDHLKDRAKSGQVALHFFPSGYSQDAQISITDDDDADRVYTLTVQALTGSVYIDNFMPEVPSE